MSVDERIIIIGSRRGYLGIFLSYTYTNVLINLLNLTLNLYYVPQMCGNRDTCRRFPRYEEESEPRFTDICRHSTTNSKLNSERKVIQHSDSVIQTAATVLLLQNISLLDTVATVATAAISNSGVYLAVAIFNVP